jgi:hypothetical protein
VERDAREIEDSNIRLGLLTQPVMGRRTRFDPNQAWRQLGKYFSAFVRRHRRTNIFSSATGVHCSLSNFSVCEMEPPAAGADYGPHIGVE